MKCFYQPTVQDILSKYPNKYELHPEKQYQEYILIPKGIQSVKSCDGVYCYFRTFDTWERLNFRIITKLSVSDYIKNFCIFEHKVPVYSKNMSHSLLGTLRISRKQSITNEECIQDFKKGSEDAYSSYQEDQK